MEDQISNSELTVCRNRNFTEKAWHLASILLFLRRPASIIELVERCSLFETTPLFVKFLCSIPNSPIHLTANNIVVLSMAAFSAFGELVASSIPKVELRLYGGERILGSGEDCVRTYFKKRKKSGNEMTPFVKRRAVLSCVDENERETLNQRIVSTCLEGFDLQTAHSYKALSTQSCDRFLKAVDIVNMTPSIENSTNDLLDNRLEIVEDQEIRYKKNTFVVSNIDKSFMEGFQDTCYADGTFLDVPIDQGEVSTALLSEKMAELSAVLAGCSHEVTDLVCRNDAGDPLCVEFNQHLERIPVEPTAHTDMPFNLSNSQIEETQMEYMSERPLIDNVGLEERVGDFPVDKSCQTNTGFSIDKTLPLNTELTKMKATSQPLASVGPQNISQKSRRNSSALENVPGNELMQKQQTPSKLLQNSTLDIIYNEQRDQKYQRVNALIDKSKHIGRNKASIHGNVNQVAKDQQKPQFPEFEAYTVEQEEGSGGYGTVYRARRKTDGTTFAIKCPHANAQKHHVKNELKMLERFGGKSFVIKLECSLKSENSDCFVLQHVEHDRPKVWKDVYGVLTCDPTIYPLAQLVPYLTFDEAATLAYFGAQVLHPQSMRTC